MTSQHCFWLFALFHISISEVCIAAGAVALGGAGLAKAKADHDATLTPKQPHELTPEERRNQPKCPPVIEKYPGQTPIVVGKDVACQKGQRVRMAEGYISHGVGTIVEVCEEGEQAGTCKVIWDSDQCHTRPLHVRLGNLHSAKVGQNSEYHLVLAEHLVCDNFEIKAHKVVEGGISRVHLEVIRSCENPPDSPTASLIKSDQNSLEDCAGSSVTGEDMTASVGGVDEDVAVGRQ